MAEEKNIVSQLRQDRKILWIAVGCGLLATILLSLNLSEDQPQMVPVLVASQTIPAGGAISTNSVERQARPRMYLPARGDDGAEKFIKPGELASYGPFQSAIRIEPGAVILWSYVQTNDETSSFSKALNTEHDMRLITVGVDEVKGVAGHLKRNDIVDVLWTGTIPGVGKAGTRSAMTKVLLEGVTVAAIGTAGAGRQQYAANALPASITLKLSQDEAALLTFAESVGDVKLILSHQDVLPANLDDKGGGIEVGYSSIKKAKTISRARREYIRITYGSQGK